MQPPALKPDPGLTFRARVIEASGSTFLVQWGSRSIEIEPIDCHPKRRSYDPTPFSDYERLALDAAFAKSKEIYVTLPLPIDMNGAAWFRDLTRHSVKAGWIWLSDDATVSEMLVGYGTRSKNPPFPLDLTGKAGIPVDRVNDSQTVRPFKRPDCGLTLEARCPVCCEGSADSWRIQTREGYELGIWLIDCHTHRSKFREAYDFAWTAMQNAKSLAFTIPHRVLKRDDYLAQITPGSDHAAWIWLDEVTTLNSLLVERGFAAKVPV